MFFAYLSDIVGKRGEMSAHIKESSWRVFKKFRYIVENEEYRKLKNVPTWQYQHLCS